MSTFLCFLSYHIEPDAVAKNNAITFELPLKRSEIADFLGLTIESVSSQMTKLRQQGVIILHENRHTEVPDLTNFLQPRNKKLN